jgi:hypothetical protein
VSVGILVAGRAALPLVAPIPPSLVERFYSSTLFPRIQSVATTLSNRTSLAWFDLLILAVVTAVLVLCARDISTRGVARGTVRIVIRLVTVSAAVYVAFAVMWGLNYRRPGLRSKVPFDASRVNDARAAALARETVTRVNDLYDDAHAEGWRPAGAIDPTLAASFTQALRDVKLPTAVVGRPKRSLLDLYFRRAGVAGMTDPFFLETLVASDILPFERPHVVAHEWAHLAGVTDEGEANFVGWLACVRAPAPQAYSGWLFLYGELLDRLPRHTAQEVSASLGTGPRADLDAIRRRYLREVSPRISTAGWQIYDGYLKANHVEAGTRSYGEVVTLILGTDFASAGRD